MSHPHHDHGHSHGGHGHHHHHHVPANFDRAFAIGVVLNAAFVVVEAGFGFVSGSMALVADAGHNLSDVLGLLVAWGAARLSARAPSERFTYGLKSSSILAALLNACLLLVAIGAIALEAVRRLFDPQPVAGPMMIIIAAIGIGINSATALLFLRGRAHDINIRGAYLHMVADAAVSAGVVVAGVLVLWTGAMWIDPVASLGIVAVIAVGTWGLLRDAVPMGLAAVPSGIARGDVIAWFIARPGVESVHDLHIWPMSTTETALTAHLRMPGGYPGDEFLAEIAHGLEHRFAIDHVTIQIETGKEVTCALAPDHVI